MKGGFLASLAAVFATSAFAVTGDPSVPQELTTTASHPKEVRPGLFDFGKAGVGWLELHNAPRGAYGMRIGEMTNELGQVTNAYPKSSIRCQTLWPSVEKPVHRVRMPVDPWNLMGYEEETPAVRLPQWDNIVFPFRFVEVLEDSQHALKAENLVRKMVHYPIDMAKSSFACDNPVLNDVYEFCKYSILATSFLGVYVDGDRERTPYEADAYINQLGHYAIDDDYAMARRTCEWLAEHPTWPTEWRQHQIMMQWADWMWSGDTRLIARSWRLLTEEMLLGRYARPADGLLVTGGERNRGCVIPRGGDIVDWPRHERDGFVFKPVNGVVNAFHYRNLIELAQMADVLGKTAEAASFRARAEKVRAAYRRVFLDSEKGLFVDGEGTRHASLHVNAAALAFGLVEPNEMPKIAGFLGKKGLACSVYFAQYLLEALFAAGRADIAVRLMASDGERSWKGMMDFGSTITMEAWSLKAKPNQDLTHAWGSAPLNVISRFVLGVTPLEPGFAKISVVPQPGGLRRVRGRVPTAHGIVSVDIDGDRLTVETPAPARVIWNGRVSVLDGGREEFK